MFKGQKKCVQTLVTDYYIYLRKGIFKRVLVCSTLKLKIANGDGNLHKSRNILDEFGRKAE